jgi:primosomal protein N''
VIASDVYAVLGDDRDAVERVVALQKTDRSSQIRFPDSAARRAHLERVVERLAEDDLERRFRELDARIDAAFASGATVSVEDRDEHRKLAVSREARKKRRLSPRG